MKHLLFGGLMAVLTLSACGPSGRETKSDAAEREAACRDTFCEGDPTPPIDHDKLVALKLNGHVFAGPRSYFSRNNNGAVFYWSTKSPMAGSVSRQAEPSSVPDGLFRDTAIEILLRSTNIPKNRRNYRFIEEADRNGWIAERKMIRPDLERIDMKHVVGPSGNYIDDVSYYVATKLEDRSGLPPVATCSQNTVDGGGGTGFMWQDGIWAGVRMNQKHCADWPEIYQAVVRVLQQLKKVQ